MSKKMPYLFAALSSAVLSLGIAAGEPPASTYTQIDYPAAIATGAYGTNARGDVVGFYVDPVTHQRRGFMLSDGNFTTIDYPGALITEARGINPQGDIVGTYQNHPTVPGGDFHGFLIRQGVFTNVDYPGHLHTIAQRITPTGQILGCYHDQDTMGTMYGILMGPNGPENTGVPASMNNGATPDARLIAGFYTDMMTGKTHGYLLTNGNITPFDVPGSLSTQAWDLSPSGEIAGIYVDTTTRVRGFLLSHGDFVSIDYPGSVATRVFGINPQGDMVGSYVASGATHGFILSRPPQHGQ